MWLALISITRLLGCVTFILHYNKKTYKIFTPLGSKLKTSELKANEKALSADFWAQKVIKVRSHLLSLSMDKGCPVSSKNHDLAVKFVSEKLEESLEYPRRQISKSFDFNQLQELSKYGVDGALIRKAEEHLRQVYLPQTSSHGDLHSGNMILLKGQLKMIDWSMYNPKGSYITDFIHFYNHKESVKHGESWTVAILREHAIIDRLSLEFNTTPDLLKLAYSISRISGEISQYMRLSMIPATQIAKYNSVLLSLITAPSRANV